MTCIAGVRDKDKVYIGGDSLGSAGYSKTARSDEKVFVKGEMIFGFTSSYRMGNIIRYCLAIPSRPENIDDMTYLVAHFIPALIHSFSEQGYLQKKNEQNNGGTFLLGYRKELYKIDNDFQVGKPVLNYDTCGCGEDLAKGALYVANQYEYTPEQKIEMALKAAEAHSGGVGGPFTILSV